MNAAADPRDEPGRAATAITAAKSKKDLIEKSGWSESNRRLPRPKRGTLTRLSYTPHTFVRSYSMTVCAHKLALGDLVEDGLATMSVDQTTEISPPHVPREVIPLHRRVVKPTQGTLPCCHLRHQAGRLHSAKPGSPAARRTRTTKSSPAVADRVALARAAVATRTNRRRTPFPRQADAGRVEQ